MSEVKTYTWDELKAPEAADKKGILMLINGKVYAISKFLDEHPGGDEVLLGEAGRDATEAFEDVGHSDEARALLDQYFVGNGPEGPAKAEPKRQRGAGVEHGQSQSYTYLYPLAGLIAYIAWKYYSESTASA
ncbi:cytochrome b5 [Leucosporidium creatinivorum]|uniref:Cytochrome b5 n=1 Tax=Leucosporidium creatinivorum TaxID=106004 RepID=A0A1Y2DPH5_9BASI|nr:cytochrome b5 [Leucosporidium creatinivorum]